MKNRPHAMQTEQAQKVPAVQGCYLSHEWAF